MVPLKFVVSFFEVVYVFYYSGGGNCSSGERSKVSGMKKGLLVSLSMLVLHCKIRCAFTTHKCVFALCHFKSTGM